MSIKDQIELEKLKDKVKMLEELVLKLEAKVTKKKRTVLDEKE